MPQFAHLLVSVGATIALASPAVARADDRADCAKARGTLLAGVVIAKPVFARGAKLKGIPLTHTHIRLRGDADGKAYDLAIDDVFAAGYQPHVSEVPPPLDSLIVGTHVEACGLPYAGGMHWVHTNCGDTPTAQDPDGWLKVIDASGSVGPNLEDSQKYCYLWPSRHKTHRSKARQSV